MKLRRLDSQNPNFNELNKTIQEMKGLLEEGITNITLEELCIFQGKDGSFSLFNSNKIPNEAIVDYIFMPTYIGTGVLMKEYLKGNKRIKENLVRGLNFIQRTGLMGHGYDAERTRIDSMEVLIRAGLSNFLEREREICPEFHHMIHNILHRYNADLINGEKLGAWGEDYKEDWQEIVGALKPKSRLYLAYGSNMNKVQMTKRCPGARVIDKTYLNNWKLTIPFYANIEREKGGITPVLVWEITAEDENTLDAYEGYPKCYDKRELLININNTHTTAMAYIMTDKHKNRGGIARERYVESIIKGYLDAGFCEDEFKPR